MSENTENTGSDFESILEEKKKLSGNKSITGETYLSCNCKCGQKIENAKAKDGKVICPTCNAELTC